MSFKFLSDTRGAAAIVFAVVAIPMIMAAGMAVDFVHGHTFKTKIQGALDAAVLATAASDLDESGRIAQGEAVFHANFDSAAAGFTITPVITISDATVTGTADGNMPTSFMQLVGYGELPVSGLAEAKIPGIGKAEVVFVLDYSSSMGDQYEAMRDAAISLIEEITNNLTATDVKIGLVPFAREVYATLPGEYVLGGTAGIDWTNCTIDRKWPWTVNDHIPTAASNSKWGRTDGDDIIDADEYDDCPNYPSNNLVIQPLSTDHNATVAQLQAMTPHSGTNVAVGLEFGWQVVSPNAPWTEGVAYSDTSWRKIIILLTDGKHNKNGFGPGGIFTAEQGFENVDSVCDAAKAEDILLITVAYELDDPDAMAQLEQCASEAQYYLEGTEENITEVFDGIGGLLVKDIYLSK